MKTYTTYILKCSDDTYYVGFTSNIDKRVIEHNTSRFENSYTSTRLPVELVYTEHFQYPNNGIKREKQIKRWSKAKKIALINGEYDELTPLAKKKFKKP